MSLLYQSASYVPPPNDILKEFVDTHDNDFSIRINVILFTIFHHQ
jgi:hypothetical protein